jgi:hypothetical protein
MDILDIYYTGKEEGLRQSVIIEKIIAYIELHRHEKDLFKAAVLDVCHLGIYSEVVKQLKTPVTVAEYE